MFVVGARFALPRVLMFAAAVGAVLSLPAASARADAAAQKKAEEEVGRAVHEIIAAYATTDLDKYFSYMAEDMSACCLGGAWITKQDYETGWRPLVQRGGGVSKSAVVDLRIQVSPGGDAAIANFQMPVTSRNPAQGQDPETRYNVTQVWMRNGGRWQLANYTWQTGATAPGPAAAIAKKP